MTTSEAINLLVNARYADEFQGNEDLCTAHQMAIDALKAADLHDSYSRDRQVYIAAINTYGETYQENLAVEECAELIQAISHKHRGREHNLAEEIADVEIMLEQLKIINNCADEVKAHHNKKIAPLYGHVSDNIF